MNTFKALFISAVALAAAGCTNKHATIPNAGIPFAAADYQVMGNTNAEECAKYIIGIDFAHLFSDQMATVEGGGNMGILGALLGGASTPEESRALYSALEKMPEATHLLAPRVKTSTTGVVIPFLGFIIFGDRCAVVDARGVKIGDKPLPILKYAEQ